MSSRKKIIEAWKELPFFDSVLTTNLEKELIWEDETKIYYADIIPYNANHFIVFDMYGNVIWILMRLLGINKKLIFLNKITRKFDELDFFEKIILPNGKEYLADDAIDRCLIRHVRHGTHTFNMLVYANCQYTKLNDTSIMKYLLQFAEIEDLNELLTKEWFTDIACRDLVINRINELTCDNNENEIKL